MSIRLKDVTKSFADKPVFIGLNAEFEDGEIYAVMGPSGCGKTTLLRLLCGLDKPDEGAVLTERENRFSFVFQEDRLLENRTAASNIALVLAEKSTEQIKTALKQTGLSDIEGKPIAEFSGGMKRRVAIVRAVMARSDVLLMDEPTKGLDTKTREKVIRYILQNKGSRSLIFTTHDRTEAQLFHAKIIQLDENFCLTNGRNTV